MKKNKMIVIKDMDKPSKCSECRFRHVIYESGSVRCYALDNGVEDNDLLYINDKDLSYQRVSEKCPLLEFLFLERNNETENKQS